MEIKNCTMECLSRARSAEELLEKGRNTDEGKSSGKRNATVEGETGKVE